MRYLALGTITLVSALMTACMADVPDAGEPPDPAGPAPSSEAEAEDRSLRGRVVTDHLLAEVTIGGSNRYSFVGVPDEGGAIGGSCRSDADCLSSPHRRRRQEVHGAEKGPSGADCLSCPHAGEALTGAGEREP